MPEVKRLAQESETRTKPEMIHGHMWGCVAGGRYRYLHINANGDIDPCVFVH